MSQEPCDPVDTLEAVVSKLDFGPSSSTTKAPKGDRPSRSRKTNWDAVRVFKEAEYRTPLKLGMYTKGKKTRGAGEPDVWLQVAIESGLVEMGSLSEGYQGDGLLDPIGKRRKVPFMSHEDLEAMIAKGIADILEK